jgi:hypothetical protein
MSASNSRPASSITAVGHNDETPSSNSKVTNDTTSPNPTQDVDLEAHRRPRQAPASHWSLVIDQTHITPEILEHEYKGNGTAESPFVIDYIPHDRRNPMNWPKWKKWSITMIESLATLAVALISSAYTGGAKQLAAEVSQIITLIQHTRSLLSREK